MLTPDEIDRILKALQESEWDEAVVEIGEVRIAVARNGVSLARSSAGAQVSTPAAAKDSVRNDSRPAPAAPILEANEIGAAVNGTVVAAPSVGIFWRSPEPGAPPFVDVGTKVSKGEVLCIVEVMKLMMNATASTDGVISVIHAQNGDAVEFGTPLFTISQS
jgi:acetyl-CoA carboxylase biotin carboxyl carrier protein